MLKLSSIFCILFLAYFVYNQNINYELACTNIYHRSRKDCTVAPRENNKRCCFVSYKDSNGQKGNECAFIYDSKSGMKSKKKEYENKGMSKVEIECNSYILKLYSNIFKFFFFIIIYFLLF